MLSTSSPQRTQNDVHGCPPWLHSSSGGLLVLLHFPCTADSISTPPRLHCMSCFTPPVCHPQLPSELLLPLLAVADQYDVTALTRLCREALAHHGRNYK